MGKRMHYIEMTKDKLVDTDQLCSLEIFNVAKTCIATSTFSNAEIFIDAFHFTIKVPFNSTKTRGLIWSKDRNNVDATFWSDGVSMQKVDEFLDLVKDITSLLGDCIDEMREELKRINEEKYS